MIQILFAFMAATCFWHGSKGFRTCGLKIGVFNKPEKPLDPKTGRLVGGLLITAGILFLIFGFIVFPEFIAFDR